MNDVIREFLIETHENLAQLDLDLVALEKEPTDRETLARVFRTLHTIKGTAGFLGLQKLQAVSHGAETLLGSLRDGELLLDAAIASALLAVVDAVRQMLQAVEANETDGDGDYSELTRTLERLHSAPKSEQRPSCPAGPAPAPPSRLQNPESTRAIEKPVASFVSATSFVADGGETRTTSAAESSIRVDVGLLDKLMTLVGELVLARNQVMQFSGSLEETALQATVQRLNLLTTELQAGVMKTRMQPISNIWSKFPRVVRDLALSCGKQARLEMEGQNTELDRTIIEAIRDPLTHLVRNAVDHGIESPKGRAAASKPAEGRLALHAFHEGGKVVIEIADDGGGIDPQKVRAKAVQARVVTAELADRMNDSELINLIFMPGFSTADKVTQFSGRGVGMDVVRTNIEKIGGAVNVESRLGRGTTIRMQIPLTLAIIPALTITSDGDRYAIPQVSLLELVRLDEDQRERRIELIHGTPVYRLRGNLLPIVYLDRELSRERRRHEKQSREGAVNIVVLQANERQFGLVVDAIHDTEEIVVKPLQKQVKGTNIFSGATIMGDGKVALILDVLGIAQKANVVTGVRERALSEQPSEQSDASMDRQSLLLFATRDGSRLAIRLSSVDRLEEFHRSKLERVGAQNVVQYGDEILPLVDVSRVLGRRRRKSHGSAGSTVRTTNVQRSEPRDNVHIVVCVVNGRRFGLIVNQIVDIVEECALTTSPATCPGMLYNAVVQDRVTEFLDLARLGDALDPHTAMSSKRTVAET